MDYPIWSGSTQNLCIFICIDSIRFNIDPFLSRVEFLCCVVIDSSRRYKKSKELDFVIADFDNTKIKIATLWPILQNYPQILTNYIMHSMADSTKLSSNSYKFWKIPYTFWQKGKKKEKKRGLSRWGERVMVGAQ